MMEPKFEVEFETVTVYAEDRAEAKRKAVEKADRNGLSVESATRRD